MKKIFQADQCNSTIAKEIIKKGFSFGMTSFILSFSFAYLLIVLIVLTIIYAILGQEAQSDANIKYITGLLALLVTIVNIIGVVFGFVGLIKEREKKIFSLLGVIFNICSLLLFVFIYNS